MTDHGDRGSRGLFAAGSPVRSSLLIVLLYAVVGALAGVVWEVIWTPPGQVIEQHQVFYDSYASLRRVFTGTGYYVVVGAVASAAVALVVTLLTRGRELLTLGLVIVGSLIAALLMLQVGTALAPGDPMSIAAHTTARTPVSGQLQVSGKSPYLIWPMTSLLVLALVFFAWPGSYARHDDGDAAEPKAKVATNLPFDRQRLVEWIQSARFTPVRVREGYDMGTVDAMLDRAALAVSRGQPVEPVLDVELPKVRLRESYDMAEVRAFLDETRAAADALAPMEPGGADLPARLPAELPADRQRLIEQIESAEFKPVRMREGYDMGTVDAMLDRAAEAVRRGESMVPVLDLELPKVRLREGYDMGQVRAFLDDIRAAADAMEPHR